MDLPTLSLGANEYLSISVSLPPVPKLMQPNHHYSRNEKHAVVPAHTEQGIELHETLRLYNSLNFIPNMIWEIAISLAKAGLQLQFCFGKQTSKMVKARYQIAMQRLWAQ